MQVAGVEPLDLQLYYILLTKTRVVLLGLRCEVNGDGDSSVRSQVQTTLGQKSWILRCGISAGFIEKPLVIELNV